jgi:hypothetical protein
MGTVYCHAIRAIVLLGRSGLLVPRQGDIGEPFALWQLGDAHRAALLSREEPI